MTQKKRVMNEDWLFRLLFLWYISFLHYSTWWRVGIGCQLSGFATVPKENDFAGQRGGSDISVSDSNENHCGIN